MLFGLKNIGITGIKLIIDALKKNIKGKENREKFRYSFLGIVP